MKRPPLPRGVANHPDLDSTRFDSLDWSMDARSCHAGACCILLVLTALHVAMLDLPRQAWAETEGAPDTRPDLEDRQGWGADNQTMQNTKSAPELKQKAHDTK